MQAFYIESTHPIHCSTCGEFRCHFSDIKEDDRQRCLESALLGMLICNPCKETVEPTPKQKEVPSKPSMGVEPSPPKGGKVQSPKEAVITWLKQTAGCSEKCATAFAGILPRSFDAVPAKEGSPNVLAVLWEGAPILEELPADAVSPAFKGKVYVLVSRHAYSLLHLRYASFSQAEANLSSAKSNSGYNLETCKKNVESTKETLMNEIRRTVVKKTIDFQVPELPAPAEEEEEEIVKPPPPEAGEVSQPKRPRDEEKEEKEEEEKKKEKRVVERVSTTEGAISFLRRHGYTLVEARILVTALRAGKNKGGKIVERLRDKTVARLTFETITTLLTEGLIETDHVSDPFDSDKKTIQKGEHVCVVLIPDEQGLVYKAISQDRGQVNHIVDLLKSPPPAGEGISTFLSNFIDPEELSTCLQRLDMENPCYLNKAGDEIIIRLNSLLPAECQNEFVKASPFTEGTCYVAIENRARDGDEEEVVYDLMTNDILLNNDNKSFEDIATKWMQEVKNF